MDNAAASGSDAAFAALALLRVRDRIESILAAIAEPRRSELALAVSRLETCDDAELKRALVGVLGRQKAERRETVTKAAGIASGKLPRGMRRWIAESLS